MHTQFELMQRSPELQPTPQPPQLDHELVKSTQTLSQIVRFGSLQAALQPPSAHTAKPPLGTVQVTPLAQVTLHAPARQGGWPPVGVPVQAT